MSYDNDDDDDDDGELKLAINRNDHQKRPLSVLGINGCLCELAASQIQCMSKNDF